MYQEPQMPGGLRGAAVLPAVIFICAIFAAGIIAGKVNDWNPLFTFLGGMYACIESGEAFFALFVLLIAGEIFAGHARKAAGQADYEKCRRCIGRAYLCAGGMGIAFVIAVVEISRLSRR